MRAFLCLSVLLLPLTSFAEIKPAGAVEFKTTVQHYDILGRNAGELRKAMDAKGLWNDAKTKRYDARTNWRVGWSGLDFDRQLAAKGIWRLQKWEVKATATVILPRWVNAADGLPFERRRWKVYLVRLNLHEGGHVKLAEQTAEALDEAFGKLGIYPSKKALEAAVKKRADKILQEHVARHVDYDRRTRHGKTQGARFP